MTARLMIGDVFDRLAEIPDNSVDLVVTSPPFLALRSYLPADHPDKHKEIGSEATPAAFIDTLLALTAEWRRILAPHGSICVELGDTYSGSGGAGGDYGDGELRDGQQRFRQQAPDTSYRLNDDGSVKHDATHRKTEPKNLAQSTTMNGGAGWPLAKSLTGIPTLYPWSLAYGRNLLTGEPSPAGRWRIRNVIVWCLDIDTAVYVRTPTGDRPMRLLHLEQQFEPGKFQLWDGERWTPVLGASTSTADDAIEIGFRNGERVSCTRNHEWPIGSGKVVRACELAIGDVVPSVRLPDAGNLEPVHVPDEIGWLCGVYLADGSFDSRDRMQISGHQLHDVLRSERLRRMAAAYGGTSGEYHYGVNEATTVLRSLVLAAIVRQYIDGNRAHNKRLSPLTWNRSDGFLRALLDGYLQSDAHYDERNDRWRLGFTDNPWLARDLRTIGARLGVSVRVKRKRKSQDPAHAVQGRPFGYRGEVRFNDPKPGRWGNAGRRREPGEIVAIRPSQRRTFIDVGIEGEPHLFALASGLLTHHCRPNPPLGALGDKFRPATSYITVACTGPKPYFDLDAVRDAPGEPSVRAPEPKARQAEVLGHHGKGMPATGTWHANGGAPPLDWHSDMPDEDGDWLWKLATAPYAGAHYATFPLALPSRLIQAMCPQRVCTVCGKPSERIVGEATYVSTTGGRVVNQWAGKRRGDNVNQWTVEGGNPGHAARHTETLGWSECGHDSYRPGLVLDPFSGSGTTLAAAIGCGRDAIGIDLDDRNAALTRERCGLFVETETGAP